MTDENKLSAVLLAATNWFVKQKAPDLKDKVEAGLQFLREWNTLEGNYKKLFGFILFDYSMHAGPLSFYEVEKEAELIGVTEEFKYYATDWISYSKNSNPKSLEP